MYVLKDLLNHYFVRSSAFNSLKSAKNVMFFSFCIFVDMPMGGGSYNAPPGYAIAIIGDMLFWPILSAQTSLELFKTAA